MSDIVIKAENIGKLYKLGEIGTGTLSHDLNRWWANLRGKEDPFAKIGQTNDRTQRGESDYVWALKDINFEVRQGEVLGIIGRNGAGKSTLLKILSKVTTPTTGQIKIKGRIASLLEVGTGFHPELTGRENIFLNGAILGMNRAEIRQKFDEIVDFAGVERYIDTPVKRYSSGMYVRLAFAVAAFLEPEILIVDEVLAVGDAEFQKKCLGRMKDVSQNNGRTVLFVSHNMEAIQNLCSSLICLQNGTISYLGETFEGVEKYLMDDANLLKNNFSFQEADDKNYKAFINSVIFLNDTKIYDLASNESLKFQICIKSNEVDKMCRLGMRISTIDGRPVGLLFSDDLIQLNIGNEVALTFELKNHNLTKGKYIFDFSIGIGNEETSVSDYHVAYSAIILGVARKNENSLLKISGWNSKNWGSCNYQDYSIKIHE
jgi:lipopolysaccharide transport system ATP-binding protein